MNEKTQDSDNKREELLAKAKYTGGLVDIRFAFLHPIQLLKNDRTIVLLFDELMRERHKTEISPSLDPTTKKALCGDLDRYIQYLEMKHRINSHNYFLLSVMLSVFISFVSFVMFLIEKFRP